MLTTNRLYIQATRWYPSSRRALQWNLVIKRSAITKPSYNKVLLLVPALYFSLFFNPNIHVVRNLIKQGNYHGLLDCCHTTAICVFWNLIVNAHFELIFKIRKKHRVYAKTRCKMYFEMRISNDGFTDTILATKSVCEWLDLRIVFWGGGVGGASVTF